ncbi:MAG: sugar phosphate isomerase/epimerase [Chloroflexota bacterium]|nr:sugar phosphate isomerase/epimerase [Chloroflexota bacterium]
MTEPKYWRPRFAYSTINWGETPDLPRMLAEIRQAGWGAVELFWHSLDWLGPPATLARDMGDLQTASLFGAVALPTDDKQLTKLMRHIDYAAAMGAGLFGLVGGHRLRWRPPADDEYTDLANFCEALARYGAERGVVVAYHPHVACTIETEAEIDILLDRTETMTLCLDASHIALVGEDPLVHLRKYRARTGYLHLKDWARGKFVEMGRGTIGIDFAAIFRELEAQRYAGWVVIEQSVSDVSPYESARINAAFVRGLGYDPGIIGIPSSRPHPNPAGFNALSGNEGERRGPDKNRRLGQHREHPARRAALGVLVAVDSAMDDRGRP